MADDKEEFSRHAQGARVYGAADDSNRQTPPEQGMRGEQGSTDPVADLTHVEQGAGGPIVVEESSGTAFAEATGRAGPEAAREDADDDANDKADEAAG